MLYLKQYSTVFIKGETDGKTILLVDDEVEITDIHQRYLIQAGYQVLVAHDGLEALELFKKTD